MDSWVTLGIRASSDSEHLSDLAGSYGSGAS